MSDELMMNCNTCINNNNNNNKNIKCCDGYDKNSCFKCLRKVDKNFIHPNYPHLKRYSYSYSCWRPKDGSIRIMEPKYLLTDKDFEL